MLTTDQILALAPDPASAKAGTAQSNLTLWSQLGANETAVWGLCQGSGKDPYRTQIELASPAFKCSCPSRKFPCKHGLGLYLLYVKQTQAFQAQQPEWVSEWLQGREQRAEKKAAKQEEHKNLTEEERAERDKNAQKRSEKREKNVIEGIELLLQWLDDIAKEGISNIRAQDHQQWEKMAARMIDAQAPGLASRLRTAGALIYSQGEHDWQLSLASALAQLSFLGQAYLQAIRDNSRFQADQVYDLRTAIGWTSHQEDAQRTNGIEDTWISIGNQTDLTQRVSSRACFLYSCKHKSYAMILQFAAGNQALPPPLLAGQVYQGCLQYYPAVVPLRVHGGESLKLTSDIQLIQTILQDSIHRMAFQGERYAEQLARNPFQLEMPLILNELQLRMPQDPQSSWSLIGPENEQIPISSQFKQHWQLSALTAGERFSLFGVWNGIDFAPLTLLHADALDANDAIYSFDSEQTL